ncbi:MAG: hypothetical protein L6R39_003839, partial [Caloplaca ligustica]
MYVEPSTRIATYVNPLYGIAPAGYDLKQTDTGRLFYVNRKDGSMTWHKPLAIEPLPAGWEAGKTADGKIYYINHVTKTNTWTKPTLPAHGAGMASGNSRPPIPVATQSAPTVPRSGHIQSQHPHAQPSFGNPANQRGTLPYQPRQPQAQAAAMQARSAVLNPRPISQQVSTATSVQPHGGQYPRQSHVAGSTSSVSALPLNQAASPQNPINPLQQQGTTLNRPTASTVGPAQSAQQNQVTTPQAARPTLQNRIFSAPATTNAMNAASNMGTKFKDSMTALAQNPNAQQIALSLGTTAIQAALTDGDSSTQASNIVILPANTPYNNPPPANQSPNPPPNQPPPA